MFPIINDFQGGEKKFTQDISLGGWIQRTRSIRSLTNRSKTLRPFDQDSNFLIVIADRIDMSGVAHLTLSLGLNFDQCSTILWKV